MYAKIKIFPYISFEFPTRSYKIKLLVTAKASSSFTGTADMSRTEKRKDPHG